MNRPPKFPPHPDSAPGDFYVVDGECLSCGAPHVVAPDLIGWVDENFSHCIWKKQPENEREMLQALLAFDTNDICAFRYKGSDPVVIKRIGRDQCDYPPSGKQNRRSPPLLSRLWHAITRRGRNRSAPRLSQ